MHSLPIIILAHFLFPFIACNSLWNRYKGCQNRMAKNYTRKQHKSIRIAKETTKYHKELKQQKNIYLQKILMILGEKNKHGETLNLKH